MCSAEHSGADPTGKGLGAPKPPSWALYTRSCSPSWPLGRHLAPYSRHWLHCPSRFGLQGALRSSKMAFGAPTWSSKPHSKFNLALLGSIFGALTTLRIELSPRRELNSHGSGIFAVQALLDCDFTPVWPQFGHLGRRLGSTWSLLGASWAQLGASWVPLGLNLEPLVSLLGASWASSPWAPLGLNLEPLGRFLGPTRSLLGASWAQLGCLGRFCGPT